MIYSVLIASCFALSCAVFSNDVVAMDINEKKPIDVERVRERLRLLKAKRQLELEIAAKFTLPPDNLNMIASGMDHNCAVFSANAKLKCWGANGSGQLGYGDTRTRGDSFNEMGQKLPFVFLGKNVLAVEASLGGAHTCARFDGNKAKCWGDNRYGQLALGDTKNRGDNANEMGDKLPFINIGANQDIVRIITGFMHTCAYSTNKKVACFGNNEHGQLGYGDKTNRGESLNHVGENTAFIDVQISSAYNFNTGPSANHTCFKESFFNKCWGSNSHGQLGYGDTNNRGDDPNEMGDNLPNILLPTGTVSWKLYLGARNTCIRIVSSYIYCFGDNQYGQLGLGHTKNIGDGPNEMGDALKPVSLGVSIPSVYATIGNKHICVMLYPSGVKCFGSNEYGQLGQGDKMNRGGTADTIGDKLPVVDLGMSNFISYIGFGGDHNCFLFEYMDDTQYYTNRIKCFGKNNVGQLGYGDTNNRGDDPNEMGNNLPFVFLKYAPPTRSPSQAPTFRPAFQPTRKPTKVPTVYPTKRPTKVPTRKPTKNPKS